jgi:heme/copper-type cytochrome/quinol oxidase subunit 3
VWWFLASEVMVFGGLIASYLVFRLGGSGWAEASHHLSAPLAALNTLVLLTSSYTVVRAFVAAERGDGRALRVNLGATVLGGVLFLAIKAVEYTTEIRAGFTPASGIFWSFYYTMTGLHAHHRIEPRAPASRGDRRPLLALRGPRVDLPLSPPLSLVRTRG